MEKKALIALIRKYQRGECTEAEKQLLEQWLVKTDAIARTEKDFLSENESAALETRIWQSIERNRVTEKKSRALWPVMRYAAIWTGILLSGYLLYRFVPMTSGTSGRHAMIRWDTLRTARNMLQIQLPDGSKLALNYGTTICYPADFGKQHREIKIIDGEAIFDVKRDTLHPFIVRSGGVTTEVLGTKFTVTSYRSLGDVKVSVSHGRVQVSDSLKVLGVLTENKALRYDLANRVATHEEDVTKFDPEHRAVLLRNCSFSEFASRIESIYGHTVYAATEETSGYTFTGDILLDESMEETLRKFSAIHSGSFTVKGKEVYMY